MTHPDHMARDLALGAAVYTAFLGASFGALVLFSRRCAAHRPYAG